MTGESITPAENVIDSTTSNPVTEIPPSASETPESVVAQTAEVATDAGCHDANKLIDELKKQLTEAEKKAAANWDNLLRQRAEFDNLQKRVDRDIENAHKYAIKRFAEELLAVKDSLEMGVDVAIKPETGLDSVKEGMELTLKMLSNTLEKFGIVEINPKNQKFNPDWHEAMAMIPSPDAEDGTVVVVHQKGYQLNERLLRPARVVIAKNS